MGNKNSRSKHERSLIKNIQEFNQIESDQERHEKFLEYYFSTSTDSIDRFHVFHFLRQYIFQSNFSSPVEENLIRGGYKVLDVGCGPGTWLLDLSSKYESSYFFGVDSELMFPQEIKPNNVEFFKADLSAGLSFGDNEFDFTHIELMRLIYTSDKWDFILSELIRVTKPGGYIEVAGRRNENVERAPILRKLMDTINESGLKRNIDINLIYSLESKFELHPNIGNVHRIEKKIIVGLNSDKIGLVSRELTLAFLKSEPLLIKFLSEELGVSEEEYKKLIEKDLVEEFEQVYSESIYVRIWAQKQLT
ncbi:S-adenosyl-L-methionine-dependent methyltransferase [Rhizophagus irregularis]|uniref:S-adenosyl-L-methionine-dependent methyltransferase n=1 Tax=Rhizophagus irregularis TaxID=588596 RepID=A0A2I1GRB0_9GLOM|nr:S-adenosyl-L-methionine-dependent methyltransferase [Rhizophagus irregularis]